MSDDKRQARRRTALTVVQGLLMASAIVAGQYAFRGLLRTPEKKQTEPAAVDEATVRKFMNDAAALVPDLSVTPEPLPIIERDRDDRPLTYLIEARKTNEFWFKATHYELPRNGGDWDVMNPGSLASAIDSVYTKRAASSAEATGNVNVSGTAGPISAGVTLPLPIRAIAEMLGLIKETLRLDVDRIEIGIKGYADGEVSTAWKPPVLSLPREYAKFTVLRHVDEHNVNPLFYGRKEYLRDVAFPYSNSDLPDLRAQFIRNEFVASVVSQTANAKRCHIYVLHNDPVPEAQQEQLRKVQVYVMVYLKSAEVQ